jgi:hypothetical protein
MVSTRLRVHPVSGEPAPLSVAEQIYWRPELHVQDRSLETADLETCTCIQSVVTPPTTDKAGGRLTSVPDAPSASP